MELPTVYALATLGDTAHKYLQQRHFFAKHPTHLPTTATIGLPTVLVLTTLGDTT